MRPEIGEPITALRPVRKGALVGGLLGVVDAHGGKELLCRLEAAGRRSTARQGERGARRTGLHRPGRQPGLCLGLSGQEGIPLANLRGECLDVLTTPASEPQLFQRSSDLGDVDGALRLGQLARRTGDSRNILQTFPLDPHRLQAPGTDRFFLPVEVRLGVAFELRDPGQLGLGRLGIDVHRHAGPALGPDPRHPRGRGPDPAGGAERADGAARR